MTILNCQKRHHEPHTAPGRRYCTGLPQWPHTRPKPPRGINGSAHTKYMESNHGIAVYKNYGEGSWGVWVECGRPFFPVGPHHPTHAEAITYAQNLVNERRQSVAD